MKAIITGMNGTVAPYAATKLKQENYEIIPWDRQKVSTENDDEIRNFIVNENPDLFFHIALGSPEWAGKCAKICFENKIKFLFTSTVDVFGNQQKGPFETTIKAFPESDYGKSKLKTENIISEVNPEAFIVRLGWQIGYKPGSNNMIDFLEKKATEEGVINASSKWIPSCSFLDDTADTLYNIISSKNPGLYFLNSNFEMSFFEIVNNLKVILKKEWEIKKDDSFVFDNRMIDKRINIINLKEKITNLIKE